MRSTAVARMRKKAPTPPIHVPMPQQETVTLPLSWFWKPLLALLYACVKPVTTLTRRKERLIKLSMPFAAFAKLLEPFASNEIEGLVWDETSDGKRLVPTKVTAANLFYKYTMIKGTFLDRLMRLEEHDGIRKRSPRELRWKRGCGAARLFLSHAGGMRDETSCLLALVCGEVKLELKEPRDWRAMPEVKIRLKVLTRDKDGNVTLPCEFEDAGYKASLSMQARVLFLKMINDPKYPTPDSLYPPSTTTLAALPKGRVTVRPTPTPTPTLAIL